MKSTIFLALASLPSTFSLALQVRQRNTTTPTATTSTGSTPVLPPPSQLTQADVAPNCARWDKIGSPGPFRCTDIIALYPETTFSELTLWNPSVGPACDNMWDSYWFCSAISGPYIPQSFHAPAGTPIAAPGIPQSGRETDPTCDRWDDIALGSSCQTFMSRYPGLSLLTLQTWNPTLVVGTNACFLNYSFELCTSTAGYVFPDPDPVPAPPTPPTGAPAPAPTQEGVIASCMKWDTVQDGKGCATFMEMYDVTLEQLVLWNPAIGAQCTGLWDGYAVCVGV